MRKFIIAIAILFGIVFIAGHFSEVERVWNTLQRGDWRYLLLSFILVFAWLGTIAGSYKKIFHAVGIDEKLTRLGILSAAATFINTVAPSAGIGGMTIFITDAQQNGKSGARTMVAGALYVIYDYLGFFFLLGLGLIVLFRRNNLNLTQIIASAILLLICGGMSFLLYLGLKSEEALSDALAWLAKKGNRFFHIFSKKDRFSVQNARNFAHDAVEGIAELRRTPTDLIYPLLLALSNKSILFLIFFLIFRAFQVPISIGTLVAGTSLAYLFRIVSPTPSGVGVVEGLLTLALRSMYVPGNDALVITLAYRGVTFWFPLLIGGIAFRWLGSPSTS
ncbi:MAG: flippase-like domain-containing protein [Anaerolineales bacterium]|nr:flippase-like domain-containing protein [Anaerolineales bacterium]MBS3751847.1 flippase-like domain-containing protein [Anaerolineales bacterium]